MAKITVKNKDGTINKKETARLKRNAKLMELERKKDMSGKTRKQRITEIPRDAIIKGTRKIMSIMPGEVGREGKKQLRLNRMAKEVDKQIRRKKELKDSGKVKKPMLSPGLMGPVASGGRVTKRPMGGKVYKVDNSGQQIVAKQYGGKING
jgi:hypothetical protein